jgi:hypothetical protein
MRARNWRLFLTRFESLTMICAMCGRSGARVRRVTRTCGRGKTFLLERFLWLVLEASYTTPSLGLKSSLLVSACASCLIR